MQLLIGFCSKNWKIFQKNRMSCFVDGFIAEYGVSLSDLFKVEIDFETLLWPIVWVAF